MNKIIALILATLATSTVVTETKTVVTKIHEDDQITAKVSYNGNTKETTIHGYDFEIPITLHEEIPTQKVVGKFASKFEDVDGNTYYQFKSNDNSVWWALTAKEIGFTPSTEREYVLLYCDNGTTTENKPCDCIAELECECEVYDDVLLGVFKTTEKTNVYPHTMVVTEIDTKSDLVTATDFTGHEWSFYGIEDWHIGDICSCIMNDNGTESVKDDVITNIKYNGNIGG